MPRLAVLCPCARTVPVAPLKHHGRDGFSRSSLQASRDTSQQQGVGVRASPAQGPTRTRDLVPAPSATSSQCNETRPGPGAGPETGAASTQPHPGVAQEAAPTQACRLGPNRDSVLVPRDRHLSCSKRELTEALLQRYFPRTGGGAETQGATERADFLRLTSLCEAVLQAQTLPLLEQLRSDWTAQGGASQPPSGDSSSRRDGALAGGGGGGGGERLERSLVALLQRSHFVSISAGDMELAEQLAADSVLTLPITVPKPEEGGEGGVLPEQGPSIMLFRRGFSVERQQGRLLGAKFDFLQAVLLRGVLSFFLTPLEAALAAVSVAGVALGKTLSEQIQDGANTLGGTLEQAKESLMNSVRPQAQAQGQEQKRAHEGEAASTTRQEQDPANTDRATGSAPNNRTEGGDGGSPPASPESNGAPTTRPTTSPGVPRPPSPDRDTAPQHSSSTELYQTQAVTDRGSTERDSSGTSSGSSVHSALYWGSDSDAVCYSDSDVVSCSDSEGVINSDRGGSSARSPPLDWRAQYQPFWTPDPHSRGPGSGARWSLAASGEARQRQRQSLFDRALSSAGYRWALVSSLLVALRVLPRVAEAAEEEPDDGVPIPNQDSPGAERTAPQPSRLLRRLRMEDLWKTRDRTEGSEKESAQQSRAAGAGPTSAAGGGSRPEGAARGRSFSSEEGEGGGSRPAGAGPASAARQGKAGGSVRSEDVLLPPAPGLREGDPGREGSSQEVGAREGKEQASLLSSSDRGRQPPVDSAREGEEAGEGEGGGEGSGEQRRDEKGREWEQVPALQDLSAATARAQRQLEEVSSAAASARREAQRQLQELSSAASEVKLQVHRKVKGAQWAWRRLDAPRRRVCERVDAWVAPARTAVSIFFSPSVLEDPAHEQVVVIQSSPVTVQPPPESSSMRSQSLKVWKRVLGVPTGAPKGPPREGGTPDRHVSVTVYRSIPLPGIKMVFPNKRLTFRPLDMIRLDLTTLIGLLAYFVNYRFDDALSSPSALVLDIVSTVALLIFVGRTSLGYLQTWNRYQLMLNAELNAKTVAVSFPAILTILDSCVQQQVMEAILCIAVLRDHQRAAGDNALTATELKAACEAFLSQVMGSEVDFPIEGTVALLLRLQIVTLVEGKAAVSSEQSLGPPPSPSQYGLRLVPSPLLVFERNAMVAVKGSDGDDGNAWHQ